MNTSNSTFIQRLPRLSGWLVITVLLLASVWAIAPQQLPVSLYKLSLVSTAAVVGYWLDRSLFPYARPDSFLTQDAEDAPPDAQPYGEVFDCMVVPDRTLMLLMGVSMLRRAIIIGCAMLAMGLGA